MTFPPRYDNFILIMLEKQQNIGQDALDKLGRLVPFFRRRDLRIEHPDIPYQDVPCLNTPVIYYFRSLVTRIRQARELGRPDDVAQALDKAVGFGVLILRTPMSGIDLLISEMKDLADSDPEVAKSADIAIKFAQIIIDPDIQPFPEHYIKEERLYLR